MAKKKTLLEQMRANPRSDWTIDDVAKLCNEIGLELMPPKTGSHFKVASPRLRDICTIPAHRPIKPPYIRNVVSYADAHIQVGEQHE
ncbi:MAG: hypothetical protein QNJ13_02230 [Paracoccaceae bacterium]|nr:hypothetical protein [Paracoccaceae bacterium]